MQIALSIALTNRILNQGGGLVPPLGFVFLTDIDGAYLTDWDGAYLVEAA